MAGRRHAPSIDQAEIAAFFAPCRGLVGSARAHGPAAQVQSCPPCLRPRPGRSLFWSRSKKTRLPQGITNSGYWMRPYSGLNRSRGWARTLVAPTRRRKISITACAHAEDARVTVDYRATTAEELAAANERFDVVLAMEVVEHVVDVNAFVVTCATMTKPAGLMIAATLNRTFQSFALATVRALSMCCAGCRRGRTSGTNSSRQWSWNRDREK